MGCSDCWLCVSDLNCQPFSVPHWLYCKTQAPCDCIKRSNGISMFPASSHTSCTATIQRRSHKEHTQSPPRDLCFAMLFPCAGKFPVSQPLRPILHLASPSWKPFLFLKLQHKCLFCCCFNSKSLQSASSPKWQFELLLFMLKVHFPTFIVSHVTLFFNLLSQCPEYAVSSQETQR